MSHFTIIPDYPRYEINEEGIIRNIKTKYIIKPSIKDGSGGYHWSYVKGGDDL